MTKKAFVYTELQLSAPFSQIPWQKVNELVKVEPGFLGKTWLSGDGNQSVGGFYEFDSLENARAFANDCFPKEARQLGVAFTTRVFSGADTEEASRQVNSAHYR